jgi:hypothetical protein
VWAACYGELPVAQVCYSWHMIFNSLGAYGITLEKPIIFPAKRELPIFLGIN